MAEMGARSSKPPYERVYRKTALGRRTLQGTPAPQRGPVGTYRGVLAPCGQGTAPRPQDLEGARAGLQGTAAQKRGNRRVGFRPFRGGGFFRGSFKARGGGDHYSPLRSRGGLRGGAYPGATL